MLLPEKILWYLLPCLGVCLSFHNLFLLSMRALQGHRVVYYTWFFRCSQFLVWAIVMLFWRRGQWIFLICNQVLCFWWIARPLLTIAYFFSAFSSLEVMKLFGESFSLLVDVVFGVFINAVRVMQTSTKSRNYGLEDPLLECEEDVEEVHHTDLNLSLNCWHILTFKSINPVMACGSRKQLNFDDLIPLPVELNPSSSYSALLSCWVVEQSRNSSHPLMLRAIYYAYRWPYLCLGLLKVFNDCIGFAGPLLLNKLIWFLQKEDPCTLLSVPLEPSLIHELKLESSSATPVSP
ncbi:Abc transporter c family member, partial [Thalictrum thalictroides]